MPAMPSSSARTSVWNRDRRVKAHRQRHWTAHRTVLLPYLVAVLVRQLAVVRGHGHGRHHAVLPEAALDGRVLLLLRDTKHGMSMMGGASGTWRRATQLLCSCKSH